MPSGMGMGMGQFGTNMNAGGYNQFMTGMPGMGMQQPMGGMGMNQFGTNMPGFGGMNMGMGMGQGMGMGGGMP